MCDPVSVGVTAAVASPYFVGRSAARRQEANMKEAMDKQEAIQKDAQAKADAMGPAAKSIDLTQDAKVYDDLKRNKVAMQQGILGTVKTNSLNTTPSAAISKTTLGS